MSESKTEFVFPVRLKRKPPPTGGRREDVLSGSVSNAPARDIPDIWAPNAKRSFVPAEAIGIVESFDIMGRSMFGTEWLGLEGGFRGNTPAFPRWIDVFDGDSDTIKDFDLYRQGASTVSQILGIDPDKRFREITRDEWCAATDHWHNLETEGPLLIRRRKAVIDAVHRHLADGTLVALIKLLDGQVYPVERTIWNCERDRVWFRLRTGSLGDMQWGGFEPPALFFGAASLAEFAGVGSEKRGPNAKGEFPPLPERDFAAALERAVKAKIRVNAFIEALKGEFPQKRAPGREEVRKRHRTLWISIWGEGSYPAAGAPKRKDS